MVQIVYLGPGESVPDEECWLRIDATDDGLFFGSGAGLLPNGDPILYVSLAESDVSLETALAAAQQWALDRNVQTICIQMNSKV